MEIIIKNNQRILIKDNQEINISDNKIIKYKGIYYKPNKVNENNYLYNNLIETETEFIGIIETHKYRYDTGIMGIYVKPLYIYYNNIWNKIVNYMNPTKKYFLYPHLLTLDNNYNNYKAMNFLDTIDTQFIDNFNFENIVNTFDLEIL
jgi:hypothetical protein